MAIVFPIVAFALFYLLFRYTRYDWRESVLAAAIAWGASLTLITEALSPFQLVTPHAVAILWIAICALAAAAAFALRRRTTASGLRSDIGTVSVAGLDQDLRVLLALAAVIVALIMVLALVAPPSSSDSMQTYLPRAMFWISNRSVSFYPTPDYLQLVFAPWPSFAMMHSILLFGADRLAGLFQAFSLLGCAIAASIIARQLGAGTRGQALAAIISITIPQGILEASGVLNSYIVSFWIAAAIAFLLLWKEKPSFLNTILVGLAGGLAVFSKGHAYLYLPFTVLACWWMCAPPQRIIFLRRSVVFVAAALLINAPAYLRNYELTKSPLGLPIPEPFRQSMITTDFRPSAVTANVIRHVSAHIGTPVDSVNAAIDKAMFYALAKIGIDPDYSIYEGDRFRLNRFSRHEILAGNHLHLALILLSFIIILSRFRDSSLRDARLYIAAIVVSFVLMSATIIWQTTTSRYHLPLFVLSAPIVGLCLERYFSRKVGTIAAGILIAIGLFYAAKNRVRSFLPADQTVYQSRDFLYFADDHQASYPTHRTAADAVNRGGCSDIGIDSVLPKGVFRDSKGALYVYPIIAMIDPDGVSKTIRYTGVVNLTSRYAVPRSEPCAVICFNCTTLPEKWREYTRIGGRAAVFGNIVVFSKDGDQANPP